MEKQKPYRIHIVSYPETYHDPRRYSLPESDRERMKRSEMNALIYFECAMAAAGYCWKDLADRLDCIPAGKRRYKMAMGAFKAVIDDIHGTIPEQSEKRMSGIRNDFKIALIPQAQNEPKKLVLDREDAYALMEAALKQCANCFKSDEEARQECGLYKILETYMPLEDYGNGIYCQYGKSEMA